MSSNETNTGQRAGLYARVSSDLQSAASIEDQLRICAERAAKEGWQVAGSYTDEGISGASLIRLGIQQLLQDAAAGAVDIILTACLATRRTSPTSTSACSSRGSGSSLCPKAR